MMPVHDETVGGALRGCLVDWVSLAGLVLSSLLILGA